MSETTHTPGPWRVEDFHEGGYFIACAADGPEPNTCIASRPPWPNRAAESEANARLIAAAPELLSFIRRCVEHSDRLVSEGEPRLPEAQEFYDEAVGLIAKAEGRAMPGSEGKP